MFSANEWSAVHGVDSKLRAEWTTAVGAEDYGLFTKGTTDNCGTVSGRTSIDV